MHEFSVMSQIVHAILEELKKHDFTGVEAVHLEVGELSFLGEEQLRFAFEVLGKGTVLEGAELHLTWERGWVECEKCGYKGPQEKIELEEHFYVPSFSCPKCGGPLSIVGGRGCTVKALTLSKEEEN